LDVEDMSIGDIAAGLNRIVVLDEDVWQLILYSLLSPYCPRVRINSMPARANLHTLLVGDIASGKSRICKIVETISPKASRIARVTEASLEGIAMKGYIEPGVIDLCNNGILIFPEFHTLYEKFKILREAMDCSRLTIIKGGETKQVNVNITFFAGCNPRQDFFQMGRKLRGQVPFKEGILSRFDILIPLVTTCEKNKRLLDNINIFGNCAEWVDLMKIGNTLSGISKEISKVKEVTLCSEQRRRVKLVFLTHNQDIGKRPLLLLRDLETISRLINVIAVSARFYERDPYNSVVQATDEDVEKAIDLWESLIDITYSFLIR